MWDRDDGDVDLAVAVQRMRLPSRDPLTATLLRMRETDRVELAKIIEPAIRNPAKKPVRTVSD